MKWVALKTVVLILTSLTGCQTVQQETRIATSLTSKEYNPIASTYLDRPTFVSVEEMSGGDTILTIQIEQYAYQLGGYENATMWSLRFNKNNVSEYLALIDKFFEWEKTAIERGDAITKEMGRAKTWANSGTGELRFQFHSGNARQHFLVVSFCASGTCLDDQAHFYNNSETRELRNLLVKLKTGDLRQIDLDGVYN